MTDYENIFNKQITSEKGCTFVIFGASGDLAKKKLYPSLYQLFVSKKLPKPFHVVGYSRTKMTQAEFIKHLKSGFKYKDESFFKLVSYINGTSYSDDKALKELNKTFNKISKNRVYYLSVPPSEFRNVCTGLKKAKLITQNSGNTNNARTILGRQPFTRILFEKPFGNSYTSAEKLNRFISSHFKEDQFSSVDHYVGKETVQNLLYFRFANSIFENLWNNKYIDHIQITLNENIRVEKRGGYFDVAGTFKDMIQSHALQVLALMCMEVPNTFTSENIRAEKAKVLQALQEQTPTLIKENMVRAQYDNYRKEDGVAADSLTETFTALKLCIHNWRWAGTPIYIRSGKALKKKCGEVVVYFKKVPHNMFKQSQDKLVNKLIFRIQPKPFLELVTYTKLPGNDVSVTKTNMNFNYEKTYKSVDFTNGYDKILYDSIVNDGTLFLSVDELLAQWKFSDAILNVWKESKEIDLHTYKTGSDGPKEAKQLIERSGREWNLD